MLIYDMLKFTVLLGPLSAIHPFSHPLTFNFLWSLSYIRKLAFWSPWVNYFSFVCSQHTAPRNIKLAHTLPSQGTNSHLGRAEPLRLISCGREIHVRPVQDSNQGALDRGAIRPTRPIMSFELLIFYHSKDRCRTVYGTERICHRCDIFGRILHTLHSNMEHKICHIRLDLVFLCSPKRICHLPKMRIKLKKQRICHICIFISTFFEKQIEFLRPFTSENLDLYMALTDKVIFLLLLS